MFSKKKIRTTFFFFSNEFSLNGTLLEYSKNGSDGNETVDVRRSVQRVETHDVLAPFFSLDLKKINKK